MEDSEIFDLKQENYDMNVGCIRPLSISVWCPGSMAIQYFGILGLLCVCATQPNFQQEQGLALPG